MKYVFSFVVPVFFCSPSFRGVKKRSHFKNFSARINFSVITSFRESQEAHSVLNFLDVAIQIRLKKLNCFIHHSIDKFVLVKESSVETKVGSVSCNRILSPDKTLTRKKVTIVLKVCDSHNIFL